MRRTLIALATMACALSPTAAHAATLHATPSNFASTFSSAAGGDTILLATGSYGSFNGGSKASTVTIAPEDGATPSMSGGNFSTSVRNITIKGVVYTGSVCINPPSNVKMGLILDGVSFGAVGTGCGEGRLSIRNGGTSAIDGNGVQIKNSTFGPGGCSDGIQDLSNGTEIGPGNEFKGIVQGGCTQHSDAIQPYASNYVHIHDNYLHDNEQGIMSPDGLSTGYLIENNSIHTTPGYPCMHLGDTRNGTVRHNVCRNGAIRVYGGNQNVASQNMVIRDNVGGANNEGCTGCTITNNPSVSSVTFMGGPGLCGWATKTPTGTATDGTNVGVNCGAAPPPPVGECNDGINNDPTEDTLVDYPNDPGCSSATDTTESPNPSPPPVDHTPVARFTASPEPSTPGQTVTFNATASTCEDTPCVYHWHDIGPPNTAGSCVGGTGNWPLGPDGATSTIAFTGVGTKCAELVLTDADGDIDKVMHPHIVSNSPPPPPPATQLLGRNTTSGINESNVAGRAEVWQYTATANGTARHLWVYVDTGTTATSMNVGLYDGAGHAGTLLISATKTNLTVGWNDVTLCSASCTTTLEQGTNYWIAVLGVGGDLHFRDADSPNTGMSYGSQEADLTSLPSAWSNGSNWSASWSLAGYVTN